MLCLVTASFTGCIGGEDLEELTPEDNVNNNDESVTPVGEDNLTGLEKRISDLEGTISDLEEIISDLENSISEDGSPVVSFLNIADYSYYGHTWSYEKSDDGFLLCTHYSYESKKTCILNVIYYDLNGVVTSYSWSGSDIEVGNYGELCQTDTDPLICETEIGSTGSFRVDVCELGDVSQTLTLNIYDNDGNTNSIDYVLDYESNCVAPAVTPDLMFHTEEYDGVNIVEMMESWPYYDLEDYTFFLKDETGSTYVGGNGFGEIAMQLLPGGETMGIDMSYEGEEVALLDRADNIANDDGSEYPVHFSDNGDGILSHGDKFFVYGQGPSANGPAQNGWILDIKYKGTGLTAAYINLYYSEYSDTIKIGFMNPITGPLEPDAYGFWWGADQAIGDLNDMYPDLDFELIEVDSGCEGGTAYHAARDLVEEGVVAVIGAACSGASMRANEVLSAAGIPMISYASTNPSLSDDDEYPLFYRVVPSDAMQGPAGIAMMVDAGVTNESLAILHMTNDFGFGLADSIKSAWEVNGELCSAGMQGYDETTTDFSGLVSAIIDDENCEAVYLSSYNEDAAGIIEELHNQGWDGQIFAGEGASPWDGSGLYDYVTDHSMLEDVTVTTPRAGFSYGDFEERYDDNADEVGGIKPYVLTAYDSTMILGKAIAESDEHHELTDNIEQVGTNYEGASGLINFLDNGDGAGNGFDICTYSGDTSDANGGYSCNRFWTVENGVQEY